MGRVKPWQIILAVVAFGVFGFSIWNFAFGGAVDQPEGILVVDVVSGELFDLQKGSARGLLLPARHPVSGERTLFPVEQLEDGTWMLRERYAPVFRDLNIASTAIDGDLRVRVQSEKVTKYVPQIVTED